MLLQVEITMISRQHNSMSINHVCILFQTQLSWIRRFKWGLALATLIIIGNQEFTHDSEDLSEKCFQALNNRKKTATPRLIAALAT